MIMDKLLQFSSAQTVTATAASTNSLDLTSENGIGEAMHIECNVTTALVGAGAIITVTVEGSTDSAFTSPVSMSVGVIPALSAIGYKIIQKFPIFASPYQYFRLKYTVSGGTLTAGGLSSALVKGVDTYTAYADAITIS